MEYLNIPLPNNRILTLGYNHAELAITDSKNFQRIEKYFYNCKDIELLRARQNPIDDLSDFIQSSLIFQCKDWADYDICKTLADINEVINTDISQQEQLERIKQILNNL